MKYFVEVEITNKNTKELTIFAKDEGEAEEKAIDLVMGWDGVEDVEVINVEVE